jgi:glycosyltransferase involved in cell wall biosynthesis
MPLVTVIIPTYQRPHLLGRSISSVKNQTFSDLELIIVDDGDGGAKDFDLPHAGFKTTVLTTPHGGPGMARNAGLHASDSRYIAYLDDDDEWLPHHLDHLVDALACAPDRRIAYSTAQVIDNGNPVRIWGSEHFNKFIADGFYTIFPPSACLHERSLFEEVGGYDEHPLMIGPEDCEFILRTSDRTTPYATQKSSVIMHRDESMTREPRSEWTDTLAHVMSKNGYFSYRRNWLMYYRAYVAACRETRPEHAARWGALLDNAIPRGTTRCGLELSGAIKLRPADVKRYCRNMLELAPDNSAWG